VRRKKICRAFCRARVRQNARLLLFSMRHHVLHKQNARARARECFFALRGKSVNLFGCIGAMDISRMHRVACALYLTNPPDYGLLNMRARAVYPISLPPCHP